MAQDDQRLFCSQRGNGSPHRRASGVTDDLRHVQSRGPGHDHQRCEVDGKARGQEREFCGGVVI